MRPVLAIVPASREAEALEDLSRRLGLPEPARLDGHDVHGRPRARSGAAFLPLSLSRCGAACAVALGTEGRVGVDLVDPGTRVPTQGLLDLATPGERAWLAALPGDPRRPLFELWACREALLKALGLGLALDPGAVELDAGLRPLRVLGSPTPPLGWHVEAAGAPAPAEGMIVALAWADPFAS